MQHPSCLILLLLGLGGALGGWHHRTVPAGWSSAPVAALASSELELSFSLRPRRLAELHKIVEQVSTPGGPLYGRHLTRAQLAALTTPDPADRAAVTSWLIGAGARVQGTDWLTARLSMDGWARLLRTEFEQLSQAGTGPPLVRAQSYWLPEAIESSVAAVWGLHGLPLPVRTAVLPGEPASVTPAVLAKTYSIAGVVPSGSANNTQAVAEFQGQYEKDSDLSKFFKDYVPAAQPGDEKVSRFVGSPDKQSSGVEASLDIQYIMGVAPHLKTEFWLFASMDFCADLANWTSTILADDSAPKARCRRYRSSGVLQVHSVSYGWQGNLTQIQCEPAKVAVVDANLAKLAAAGISVMISSGDSGSGYQPPQTECFGPEANVTNHTRWEGTVLSADLAESYTECCNTAEGSPWSWEPTSTPWSAALGRWLANAGRRPTCETGGHGLQGKVYTGQPVYQLRFDEVDKCCNDAEQIKGYFDFTPGSPGFCNVYLKVNGTVDRPGCEPSWGGVNQWGAARSTASRARRSRGSARCLPK